VALNPERDAVVYAALADIHVNAQSGDAAQTKIIAHAMRQFA
jgi:hypothetical protein